MSGRVIRLGLVGPLPPPSGGMAMQLQQLAHLLTREDIQVTVVQTNAPYRPRIIEQVVGVRAVFRLLPYLVQVYRLAGRVDVIHAMANSGWSWQLFAAPVIWIGWLRKTPVIINYRGGGAREYLASSHRWIKPSLDKAAKLVVPSGFLQEVFLDYGAVASVIPNIIDPDIFFPAPGAGPRPTAGHSFTVVITRNLETIYGIDTAIRAVAMAREQVPDIRLKIAGSGPQQLELEQLAQTLHQGDAVVFLGRLERSAIVELYHEADIMLNPSRVDNMPNSVLEAMACGLPVISTSVGGVPYVVRDGETAVLVEPDNVSAMAAALVRLGNDAQLRRTLADNGLRDVAQYYWTQVRRQWIGLYQTVVAAA